MDNFEKVPKGIFDKVTNNKELFISEFKEKLEEVFPSAVKDGIVDFEALLNEFGKYAETDEKEKYNMTWVGKKDAIRKANEDIVGKTLKYVPEESKNPGTTQNLYIEGDNLEVLKLLRNSYYQKVKMIYIDPPYNTGNDFVYNDTFKIDKEEYEKAIGDVDEYNEKLTASKKGSGRYHSAWLNMMYTRLKVAKDLLKDDGVIFISIDDNEVENLKKICNELFGSENFVAQLPTIMNLNGNNDAYGFVDTHEYTLCYVRNKNIFEFGFLPLNSEEMKSWDVDDYGYWKKADTLRRTGQDASREKRPKGWFPVFINDKNEIYVTDDDNPVDENDLILYPVNDEGEELSWTWSKNKIMEDNHNLIVVDGRNGKNIYKKQRPNDGKTPSKKPKSLMYRPEYSTSSATTYLKKLLSSKIFDTPKPIQLIVDFLTVSNTKDSIILDFFSGSSTTAHAVMQLNAEDGGNRKFIMVQLPELCDEKSNAYKVGYKNICEIGKERIRRAGDKILEENKDKEGIEKLDVGFKVFRVADTNIRWISDTLSKNISMDEYRNDISSKDQLDFNPHFTDIDVVYEMMLKRQDIELTERIDKLEDIGDRTYLVGYTVLVCLEEEITEEMVKKISEIDTSLSWIVFRDSAFGDDINLKTNTMNLLRTLIKEKNPKSKNQKILWI